MHLKGDINATADNAHVLIPTDKELLHLVLGKLTHQWQLPAKVINALLTGSGPKKGRSAIFNEYVASFEHDWEDVSFTEQDYGVGYREPGAYSARSRRVHQDDDLSF